MATSHLTPFHNPYPTPESTPPSRHNVAKEPMTRETLPLGYVVPPYVRRPRRLVIGRHIDNLKASMSKSTTVSLVLYLCLIVQSIVRTTADLSDTDKPTIRRLARRGGIKRINRNIYQTIQEIVKDRLKLVCFTHNLI